jgi:uncharacterized SAM-binding protein YcdF (DUF218 family)
LSPYMHRKDASSRAWWAPGIAWLYFAILFLLLLFMAFLWKSGQRLVRSDSFGHVRWALVLAGENNNMERSKAALTLFREGRFDSLILSGPAVYRTHHESEFSEEWLLSKGFPKDRIFQFPHNARSTQEEAEVIIPQLRLLRIDTLLLITSNFHTARAARIFERLDGGDPVLKVYSADDPDFDPKAWWTGRESRLIWVTEWLKTLHTAWELMGQKPLTDTSEAVVLEPDPRSLLAGSRSSDSSSVLPSPCTDTSGRAVLKALSPGKNLTDSLNRSDTLSSKNVEKSTPEKSKTGAKRKKKRPS